jgi:multidrug resistance efflux pump
MLRSAKNPNAATGTTARAPIDATPHGLNNKQTEARMPKLDERINALETKLKQLKVRQQRVEARARALASSRARKDDTRRKILIGATMLARIDRQELDHDTLQAWLNAHLTRDDDRALFDLPPIATG